jgi:hypothetical protein
MCFVRGEMDWMTNPTMKRRMSHHLLDHKNQQQKQRKVNKSNPINIRGKWNIHTLKEAMDVVERGTTSLRNASGH